MRIVSARDVRKLLRSELEADASTVRAITAPLTQEIVLFTKTANIDAFGLLGKLCQPKIHAIVLTALSSSLQGTANYRKAMSHLFLII